MGRLAARLLGISEEEVTFQRRGFTGRDEGARRGLEEVGRAFVGGYTAALEEGTMESLARRLDGLPRPLAGFAHEGAAMALALLDHLTPWRRGRLAAFLDGPGRPHAYLVHVGAGWALARLPVRLAPALRRFDPVLRWLALDGFGFHEGFFHWPRTVEGRQAVSPRVRGYGRRAFDQGLGRSLWFVRGADPEAIAATVAGFAAPRRADLWSGVGLACAYAGGVDRGAMERLWEAAGPHRGWLAQGAAFAAQARRRAGNLVPATELACRLFCGSGAVAAAEVTDEAGVELPPDGEVPAFEEWRQRIERRFRESRSEPCPSYSAATA
jgi:enediyne biosynthesis protein E3